VVLIYELTFRGYEIRINVFSFEELVMSFPKQVLVNFFGVAELAQLMSTKLKQVAQAEVKMTTKLNLDSFNYDYHVQNIFKHIFETN